MLIFCYNYGIFQKKKVVMMKKKIQIKKGFAALLISGLVFVVIAGLHLLGVFHFLEYKSYDMRVRFWAASSYSIPSDEIVVILLDQDSIDWAQRERGWGWPWPRQAYAEIVDYLNSCGAKSAAFDVIFSEPSIYSIARQNDEDDVSFIRASERYGRVVQTVMFSSQTGSALSWPGYNMPMFQTENFGSLLDNFSVGEGEKAQFPIQGLVNSAGALGSVTGVRDSDEIIRRLKLFTLFDGKAIPGFSAASLLVSGKNQNISYNSKTKSIDWDGFSIPVDKNGNTLLRYRGELDRYIPYRAMDILQSADAFLKGEEPLFFTSNFENTHVFFGFYAQGHSSKRRSYS